MKYRLFSNSLGQRHNSMSTRLRVSLIHCIYLLYHMYISITLMYLRLHTSSGCFCCWTFFENTRLNSVAIGLLCIVFTFPARVLYSGVLGFIFVVLGVVELPFIPCFDRLFGKSILNKLACIFEGKWNSFNSFCKYIY